MKTVNFKNNFMQRIIYKTLVILLISIILSSCSKSDSSPETIVLAPLQDPLAGYLTASGFNQTTLNVINTNDYEFGFSFIPLTNGKITALVAKLPATRIAMRVTVWDKAVGTIIRTETIDVATANVEFIKQIPELDLVKDKEYFFTMNSNDYFERRKNDASPAAYPFTVGDIKITGYGFKSGTTQTMPNVINSTYYAGDCSFKFQK